MPPQKSKPKRAEIFVGGTGILPVMHFAHGAPLPLGADNEIGITIETPTHRYTLHRMLTYEDQCLFPIWTETSCFKKFLVRVLCGAECDFESGLCHWDTQHPPSTENMCAVKWGDDSWLVLPVNTEELPLDARLAHLKTLANENCGGPQVEAIRAETYNLYFDKQMAIWRDFREKSKYEDKTLKAELACLARDAKLMATPPERQKWWENLIRAYRRTNTNTAKTQRWQEVARIVLKGVQVNMDNPKVKKTDYLSPPMYKHIVRDFREEKNLLSSNSGDPSEYEKQLANNLRIYANREARKQGMTVEGTLTE